ncbi:MAG: IclR family transcriptional regulator [Comamonas sp.]
MDKERTGIQSVEVGFALLQALADAPGPLMLKDLAAAAHMPAAKAHRYLVSYQRSGLVVQDAATARYDLGPMALQLGLAALRRSDPVRLARERLPEMLAQLNHTVALAVWGNRGATIVHWEEPPQGTTGHLRLGDVMPLLSSATGRCFGAWLPAGRTAPLLQSELELARSNQRDDLPQTPEAAEALFAEVRERGSARVVDTLLPSVVAFCAPVFDARGHVALAITTLGTIASFDPHWGGAVDRALQAVAAQLSHDVGFDGRAQR